MSKEKCLCGYEGEFDLISFSQPNGYGGFILAARVSDPENFHKGSIDLMVCPKCLTVKISTEFSGKG